MIKSKYILVLFAAIVFGINIRAAEEATETLTKEQKALQADIEHSLVAPCCWNMTLDQHESPKVTRARSEITGLIKQGKTKTEILDYFVAQPQYGERILATPSQKTWLGKSAYFLIPIAIIFGAVFVGLTIKSFTKPGLVSAKTQGAKKSETVRDESDPWSKKVEEELKKF